MTDEIELTEIDRVLVAHFADSFSACGINYNIRNTIIELPQLAILIYNGSFMSIVNLDLATVNGTTKHCYMEPQFFRSSYLTIAEILRKVYPDEIIEAFLKHEGTPVEVPSLN